ncbi:MAG: M3 family oligoendopeptidase [Caldisericia bacterium]|nr:M3 family oligoendopeptidase [Caldisericia bacterium]
MNRNWDLSVIYPSFYSSTFHHDWSSLSLHIEQYSNWLQHQCKTHDHEIEFLKEYIHRTEQLENRIHKLASMIHLTLAVDTSNSLAKNYMEALHKKLPLLTASATQMKKWVGEVSHLSTKLSSDPELHNFQYYFSLMQQEVKHMLSEPEEVLLSQLRNTGSSAWSRLQGELISTCTITKENKDGHSEDIPLSKVLNMTFSKDPDERKTGFEMEMSAYKHTEHSCAASLNAIKGEFIELSKKRGYASPLDHALHSHRMNRATLDSMIQAVEEMLPTFEKFNQYKARKLGYSVGLPFYDLHAPIEQNSSPSYSYEDASALVLKIFASFDSELEQMGSQAFRGNWIDVDPKKGKRNGAFCSSCPAIKQSRILLNFTGSIDNIFTMAHELGHAFHNQQMFKESTLLQSAPMPLAETASIFNEMIAKEYLFKNASEDEKRSFLLKDITRSTQVIVDIYSRFQFELEVFKAREEGLLDAKHLCELMKNAQIKAYMKGIDPSLLHPYMWINKPHYYMPNRHFYNVPYTFGELFGKSLFVEYKKSGQSFIPTYKTLLQNCGKGTVEEIASSVGLNITKPEFWKQSLAPIKQNIDWLCYQ